MVTDGGRVLNVTALGATLQKPRLEPTKPSARSSIQGAWYRRDIAGRPVGRSVTAQKSSRLNAGAAGSASRSFMFADSGYYAVGYFLRVMILGQWSILNNPFKEFWPL